MKQYITESQLGELSTQAKKDLHKWWKNKGYELDDEGYYSMPLLSIGQMIEFLDEHTEFRSWVSKSETQVRDGGYLIGYKLKSWDVALWIKGHNSEIRHNAIELCDALFEAVKQILEKE